MTEKYINPFTDFGFKKLFGEESNKDLLKDFLGELVKDQDSLKHYRDWKYVLDTAIEETKTEIATQLRKEGMAAELIAKLTGLSVEENRKVVKIVSFEKPKPSFVIPPASE